MAIIQSLSIYKACFTKNYNVSLGLVDGVTVLKGANIASGSIVGAESVVTKSFDEPNAIYASVPAKKIRSNIKWYRDAVEEYLEKNAN